MPVCPAQAWHSLKCACFCACCPTCVHASLAEPSPRQARRGQFLLECVHYPSRRLDAECWPCGPDRPEEPGTSQTRSRAPTLHCRDAHTASCPVWASGLSQRVTSSPWHSCAWSHPVEATQDLGLYPAHGTAYFPVWPLLCPVDDNPAMPASLLLSLAVIVPCLGHARLRPQCPAQAAEPSSGHSAQLRPRCPVQATLPCSGYSAQLMSWCQVQDMMPSSGHDILLRPWCPALAGRVHVGLGSFWDTGQNSCLPLAGRAMTGG